MSRRGIDCYGLLGVAQDADEATLAAAYAARAAPAARGEGSARSWLRDAYEVLASPTSRYQHDEACAHAEVREALALLVEGDRASAQVLLLEVMGRESSLLFVRFLLGRIFMEEGRPKEASRVFSALAQADPASPLYAACLGRALSDLGQHDAAAGAFRAAAALRPDDVELHTALAGAVAATGKISEAVAALDHAIHLDAKVDHRDVGLLVEKARLHGLEDRPALVEQTLDLALRLAPAEPSARRELAAQLLRVGVGLLSAEKTAGGRAVLSRCRKVDPSAPASYDLPGRIRLRWSDLPRGAAERLSQAMSRPGPERLPVTVRAARTVTLLALTLLLAWCQSFGRRDGGTPSVIAALWVMGCALAIDTLGRRAWTALRGGATHCLVALPAHLVEVEGRAVTVCPLVNLERVHLAHAGVSDPSATDATFVFGGEARTLRLFDRAAAEAFAALLVARRRELLDRLVTAGLGGVPELELIPPALLEPAAAARGARLARLDPWRRRGIAAASGALLFGLSIPYSRRAADREAWAEVQGSGAVSQARAYLGRFPRGRHAADARSLIHARYDEAIAKLTTEGRADAPGKPAVLALLRALKDADRPLVRVAFEPSVEFSTLPAGGPASPAPAFTPERNREREAEIASALRRAFASALPADLLIWDERASEEPAASIAVRYRIRPSGAIFYRRSEHQSFGLGQPLHGVLFEWALAVRMGSAGVALEDVTLASRPAHEIRFSVPEGADAELAAYDAMAQSTFADFARRLAWELGIGVAPKDDR